MRWSIAQKNGCGAKKIVAAQKNSCGVRQTISFIEISIEAGILLGGKHEAYFVLVVAGIEPMPS